MIKNIIICLLIILIVIGICCIINKCLYGLNKVENFSETLFKNDKPIIWTYWETKPGKTKPEYLDLCLDTLFKYCNDDFNIIRLNEKNIYDYLPNLRKDMDQLLIAQKTDYIRVALLYKYGGIWIDADTIVMRKLNDIISKLNEGYDYIGFGCSEPICFNGYPKPSNGVMASKKSSVLMEAVLKDLDNMLDSKKQNYDYFDLGKVVLWRNIDELLKEGNFMYYQYPSAFDGSRDKDGVWVNVDNHISKDKTELIDKEKLFFVFLENNKFMGNDDKYNWFSKLTKNEVLNGDYWISQLFRDSLNQS